MPHPQPSLPPDKLSAFIRAAFSSNEILAVLLDDSTAQSGPFDGGCLIVAKALLLLTGKGTLIRIVRHEPHTQTEHYGIEIDGHIYDASGKHQNATAWINTFASRELIAPPLLFFAYGYDEASDIPDDPRAIKELTSLLVARQSKDFR